MPKGSGRTSRWTLQFFIVGFIALLAVSCNGDNKGSPGNVAASASISGGSCAGAIDWSQAAVNVGKQATVRGPVMGGNYAKTSNGQPTFIDVGKSYPASGRFSVLIWGSDRGKFPGSPESTYKGKPICVTGLIESYQGSPEIVVNSPNAIAVQ